MKHNQKQMKNTKVTFKKMLKHESYSATRLTVATQQTFFTVSQSGYANLILAKSSRQVTQQRIIENISFCILWLTNKK